MDLAVVAVADIIWNDFVLALASLRLLVGKRFLCYDPMHQINVLRIWSKCSKISVIKLLRVSSLLFMSESILSQ